MTDRIFFCSPFATSNAKDSASNHPEQTLLSKKYHVFPKLLIGLGAAGLLGGALALFGPHHLGGWLDHHMAFSKWAEKIPETARYSVMGGGAGVAVASTGYLRRNALRKIKWFGIPDASIKQREKTSLSPHATPAAQDIIIQEFYKACELSNKEAKTFVSHVQNLPSRSTLQNSSQQLSQVPSTLEEWRTSLENQEKNLYQTLKIIPTSILNRMQNLPTTKRWKALSQFQALEIQTGLRNNDPHAVELDFCQKQLILIQGLIDMKQSKPSFGAQDS